MASSRVIYHLLDEAAAMVAELMDPVVSEEVLAVAEVRPASCTCACAAARSSAAPLPRLRR